MDYGHYEPASQGAPAALPSEAPAAVNLVLPAAPIEEAPRFVGGRPRSMEVRLDFPIEFRGRLYEAITLRRPSAAEVGAWFERLAEVTAADPSAALHFPIFVDETGDPIPREVLDFLDGEDDERVMELSTDFLPPRFRRMQEAASAASTLPAGADTGPKSSS
jgi:hypothetical protein